jgi:hypothetical protein
LIIHKHVGEITKEIWNENFLPLINVTES